uniref:Uncharacterized protein n=1 Tax=Panagrolaimus sp. ES5 TaxID=591445 RepID=A0AC34GAU1_9BILA
MCNVHVPETFDATEFDVRGEFVRCACKFVITHPEFVYKFCFKDKYTLAFPNGLPGGEQQWQALDAQLESLDSDELPFGLK